MKRIVTGILAHVDAGKTTLAEAMLYKSGAIRKLGRVDHKDAFLDTNALERERGITIFSKQALLHLDGLEMTLLDTPGHVDFSSEMERTLRVLDCAILVINGADGVQSHTLTLWRLLEKYQVPVFLFVNKMDLATAEREKIMEELRQRLDSGCVDFNAAAEVLAEEIAMCDEMLLDKYLEQGSISDEDVQDVIANRKLFPCFFGSALKITGIDEFLSGLSRYAPVPDYPTEFGAQVFKISRDNNRLTWLKITGGTLHVKELLTNRRSGMDEENIWSEKINQIRIYSGIKFKAVEEISAGSVCAVTGLSRARVGDGLGFETNWTDSILEPVLTYELLLPDNTDPHNILTYLRQLEEEDPQLHVVWNEMAQSIYIRLMGEVQLEVLQRLILENTGAEILFKSGGVIYRETIAEEVEGIGHFEPLRHYAEVHLLLSPLPRGSGIILDTICPEDALDRNWQRLILTHLAEKEHIGTLTGSPITDIKMTLIAGRAHIKHTEGGDFREATYRAVRQGLMQTKNILLEPWYDFHLELPSEQAGRAINDLQNMKGDIQPLEIIDGNAVLIGSAPVIALKDYAKDIRVYTKGLGRISLRVSGFRPCAEQDKIVAAIGYNPERDIENTPDSVFYSHGSGYIVPWNEVSKKAHIFTGILKSVQPDPVQIQTQPKRRRQEQIEEEKELQAIFERTYGAIRRRQYGQVREPQKTTPTWDSQSKGLEYLLVDGYNIIFAWDELKAIARENLDAARKHLCDILCDYQGYKKCVVIVVFDAYKVRGNLGSYEKYHNIYLVYTKEAETADTYIERVTEITKGRRVRVATSDGPERLIILGHGALRVSATAFHEEVEQVRGQIAELITRNNQRRKTETIRTAFEKAINTPESKENKNTDRKKNNLN